MEATEEFQPYYGLDKLFPAGMRRPSRPSAMLPQPIEASLVTRQHTHPFLSSDAVRPCLDHIDSDLEVGTGNSCSCRLSPQSVLSSAPFCDLPT